MFSREVIIKSRMHLLFFVKLNLVSHTKVHWIVHGSWVESKFFPLTRLKSHYHVLIQLFALNYNLLQNIVYKILQSNFKLGSWNDNTMGHVLVILCTYNINVCVGRFSVAERVICG